MNLLESINFTHQPLNIDVLKSQELSMRLLGIAQKVEQEQTGRLKYFSIDELIGIIISNTDKEFAKEFMQECGVEPKQVQGLSYSDQEHLKMFNFIAKGLHEALKVNKVHVKGTNNRGYEVYSLDPFFL